MSHTPGPWVCFSSSGRIVAVMPAMRPGDICEVGLAATNEDMRLIAAAPELLEALQDLTAQIAADENADCLHLLPQTKVFDAALAAIAKATGEGA